MKHLDESDLKIKKNSKTVGDIIFGGISLFLLLIIFFFNIQNEVCLSRKFIFPQAYANKVILTVMGVILLITFITHLLSLILSGIFIFSHHDTFYKVKSVIFSTLNTLNIVPVILIIVLAFDTFVASTIDVSGDSMKNTVQDGNAVLVSHTRFEKLEKGDIVILNLSSNNKEPDLIIKRVWALEGDTIKFIEESGYAVLYVNGEKTVTNTYTPIYNYINTEITLGKGDVFVMGDNFKVSKDSRYWGIFNTIKKNSDTTYMHANYCGKVTYSIMPFGKIEDNRINSYE